MTTWAAALKRLESYTPEGRVGRILARAGVRADFDEAEHPRDESGEFTEKGGGAVAAPLPPPANAGKGGAGGGDRKARPTMATIKVEREGKKVHMAEGGAPLPDHIAKLKIPPAWNDVRYNENPDADLLAVGKDSKGRAQAIYSNRFISENALTKFARSQELRAKFPLIYAQNNALRGDANPKVREAADCLHLIMQTGLRPGGEGDTGADKQAYGASTLQGQHVVQTKDGVRLKFTGKKGVALDIPVDDQQTAEMLVERAKNAGPKGKLFDVSAKQLLDHAHGLDGGGFKTKDFRTRLGTETAYNLVKSMPAPANEKDRKKSILAVAKQVAAKLGNTATIALQSYIDPQVFSVWQAAA